MDVVHVTRDFPPRINGGLSTAVGGLVRALADIGVAQRVVSFDAWRPRRRSPSIPAHGAPPRTDTAFGVAVLRVTGPAHLAPARAFCGRPDVIHVHDGMLDDFAAELSAPSVFSVHVAQAMMRRLRGGGEPTLSELAQAKAMGRASVVVLPSPGVRDALPTLAPGRPIVLPLGLHDHPDARAATETPRVAPVVLYAGRFADVKGTSDLIEIIEATWRRRPTARFVVAGGLVDNRKAERRWRRRFDDQLSAGARGATELVGWLSPEALSAALARTRVMVVPSRYETFGLSAAEAMLHGVPVVATDNPGTRAVLPPDAPPMGLAEIAEALATLLEDGALAAARGTAAARYARDHHLWPRHIAGYRAAYAQAAAAR